MQPRSPRVEAPLLLSALEAVLAVVVVVPIAAGVHPSRPRLLFESTGLDVSDDDGGVVPSVRAISSDASVPAAVAVVLEAAAPWRANVMKKWRLAVGHAELHSPAAVASVCGHQS